MCLENTLTTSSSNYEEKDYLDMPDLISISAKQKNKIIVYPLHEYWLDIGKPETLDQAHFEWN